MDDARVQTAKDVLEAYNKAAVKVKERLDKKSYEAVGTQMVKYAEMAYKRRIRVSDDEAAKYYNLKRPEIVAFTNLNSFVELIKVAGVEFVTGAPRLACHAETLIEGITMTYPVSAKCLNEQTDVLSSTTLWRGVCVKALSGLKKNKEDGLKVCGLVSTYLKRLPITEKSYKEKLGKGASDVDAVKRYLQFYKPLLLEACQVYKNGKQKNFSRSFEWWSATSSIFKEYLLDNLRYVPEVEAGVIGIINMSVGISSLFRYKNYTAELVREIKHPDEHTKDVFKFAVEHVDPNICKDVVISLAEYCDPKHVAFVARPSRTFDATSQSHHRRPRFRFQRGSAAARRKASIAKKKKDCAQRAKDSEGWGAPVAKLMQRASQVYHSSASNVLKDLLSSPIMSKEKRNTIKAVYTALDNCTDDMRYFNFNCLRNDPNLEAFMAKHVTSSNVKAAVVEYLGPFHKRKRRMQHLIKKGLGSCDPRTVFAESTLFQKYVFKYYPEQVKTLLDGRKEIGLPGIVDNLLGAAPRFGGQTTDVMRYVHTLPPWVQQYLWDEWIIPCAFDVESGKLFLERSSYEGQRNEEDGSHQTKAKRMWLGAAMSSAPKIPPVTSADHPFNKFFVRTIIDKEAVEDLTKEEEGNVKKSSKLAEGILRTSRSAQLCLELLLALRTHDYPLAALEVLTAHLDQGVAVKTAIPSTAAALRCISPNDACEVLQKVLGREETRAAARSQLGRCCIKLLHPEQALGFVEREWKQEGSWVMVSDEEEKEEEEEEDKEEGTRRSGGGRGGRGGKAKVFASTKVALICSLVTSPSLRELPSLWGRIMSISETRTEENIYIAGQMLEALAGTNGVRTLNIDYWPLCAADGLAGLVASFSDVKILEDNVFAVLRKWFKMLKCNPSAEVSFSDSEGVTRALLDSTDSPLVCEMIKALTATRPGLFAGVCKHKTEQMAAAAASRALGKLRDVRVSLTGVMENGETAIEKAEYGKAIDVLVRTPGGVSAAIQLVANHWAAHKEDRSEGAALRKMAEILDEVGQQGYNVFVTGNVLSKMKKDRLAEICREMLEETDDAEGGAGLPDSYKYVLLKYIKYCRPHSADSSVTELVRRLLVDPSGVVAAAAADTLDSMPATVYRPQLVLLDKLKRSPYRRYNYAYYGHDDYSYDYMRPRNE
eukprot:TRINITY_DN141_c0_g2_i4.p1 TRINITY_DN141_c0_g2~~TRINITY_DN141_c0_g2_i4.p1  ORF type:complete len:1162 (+),score=291.73 TRINITY_DN141_c0_g2_i4:2010-5495(+)